MTPMAYGTLNDGSSPWFLTIIRAQGLAYVPVGKKIWRPVVTVKVHGHHAGAHEIVLGTDGQCTNLKVPFELHGVDASSKLDILLSKRSEGKKKKGNAPVAGTDVLTLGELLKKQEQEKELKLRLNCVSKSKRGREAPGRGRPQNGAVLILKLVPPADFASSSALTLNCDELDSCLSTSPTLSPISEGSTSGWGHPEYPSIDQTVANTRPRKGYHIHSDGEDPSDVGSDSEGPRTPVTVFEFEIEDEDEVDDSSRSICFDKKDASNTDHDTSYIDIVRPEQISTWGWIAASLLPSHIQDVQTQKQQSYPSYGDRPIRTDSMNGSVRSTMTLAQRSVASFTVYADLREADHDEEYETVFKRLQSEWTFIGGLLVALSAVNAALLALPTDGIFDIDGWAQIAVANSSVAAGMGLATDAWFLLRYNFNDLETFKYRARDVFDSYFFFSISARVPAVAMFISAVSLMCFLALVAFEAWPRGVLVVSLLFGVILSLQFLAFGVHRCARGVVWVAKGLVGFLGARTQPQPEDSSPLPAAVPQQGPRECGSAAS